MNGNVLNATVVFREDSSDQSAVFRVKPDHGRIYFTPGQFVTVGLPEDEDAERPEDMVRRPYSIASPVDEHDHVELFLSRVDNGELTTRLWELQVGSRLWMDDRIKGTFTLDDIPLGNDLLMVSTGTGVAPFVSMLRSYNESSRWRRFVLVNGARTEADLGYHAELDAMSEDDPSITYLPAVSQESESSDWKGLRGRVQEALATVLKSTADGSFDPARCHAFLCGNPDMIESVAGMLGDHGLSGGTKKEPGNIHFERYWH